MNTFETFTAKVAAEIQAADGPSIARERESDFMAQLNERKSVFERGAKHVLEELVRPRMQALISFFPNATLARKCEFGHSTWWFGYTERFPASVKLDLSVDHDELCENLVLAYELSILPSYAKYDRFDRIEMPLDAIDEAGIAAWLENRLIKFVRTYVGLEKTDRDQTAALVTDPVCGMRINQNHAAATFMHAGHAYYLCSTKCLDEFSAAPNRFAKLVLS